MELEVVVGVEDVVLAVVLVLGGDLHPCQHRLELGARVDAVVVGRVGVAAPVDVGLGEVGVGLPVPLVDQRQDAGAVAARLRAEDAVAGAAPRGLGVGAVQTSSRARSAR